MLSQNIISASDLDKVYEITDQSWENVFRAKKKLKEKFDKLAAQTNNRLPTGTLGQKKIQHEVIDLTKDGIDDDVKAYLRLGPNFSETPKFIPYEKLIIETEKMCKTIENEMENADATGKYELEREVHTLREKVKKLLLIAKDKKIKPNLQIKNEKMNIEFTSQPTKAR